MNKSLLFFVFCSILLFACDDGGNGATPVCESITCSGHGTCADVGGYAACACENGYHPDGLECVPTVCVGDPPLSDLQYGVCGGSLKICDDGEWSEPDYASIEGYEAIEATCDVMVRLTKV